MLPTVSSRRVLAAARSAAKSAKLPSARSVAPSFSHANRTASRSSHTGAKASPVHRGYLWGSALALGSATLLYLAANPIRNDAPRGSKQGSLIRFDDLRLNNGQDGKPLWVSIEGHVYDLTSFLDSHPGGKNVILKNAGSDVTELYRPIHPPNAIRDNLKPSQHIGMLDPATVPAQSDKPQSDRERARREALENLPEVGSMLNLDDFELVAQKILTDQAWAYYSSAGDTETSMHQNRSAYSRIYFKPRILVAVSKVDPSVHIHCIKDGQTGKRGWKSALPFYISPAALAKLGHPEGELNLTRAAGKAGIIQGISANASAGLDEMLDARTQGQPVIYQLYVNRDRAASERLLSKVEKAGVSAVMLTVDAPVMGKRERDMRAKGEVVQTGGGDGGSVENKGVAAAISGYIDADLSWKDIAWYRKNCSLPLILKGIQSVEDAKLAAKHGIDGIVLSNHGGRSLDFSPPPIDVLVELRQQAPEVFDKLDVFVDGGIRRGTDVLKALALGAKAVGLGRPFLYAQSGFGEPGAARAIDILQDEIERGMRLLGVTSLDQLGPHMVEVLPKAWCPPPTPEPPRSE